MNPKHIAAIEIGSSRIKGIVASHEPGAPMKVIAVEASPAGDAVRYGRIQNPREANDIVNDIIRRLENSPRVNPGRITSVFIADGGRSLLSSSSEASLNFGGEEEITARTLERLHKEAVFKLGPGRDILAIAPRRFFIDASEVKKIVGAYGSNVRGEFTIITQAQENHRALERLFIESDGKEIKRDLITRLIAQTDMALSDSDRQVGTLFVDFGAETTTMAAFRDGALVFAATLPIGSANITRDLVSALSITFDKAENLKRTKGAAVVDRATYEAPDDATGEIVGIVSARASEIVANVDNLLVEAGLRPTDFPGGIVIAGGGAQLKGFPEMVEALLKLKVRRAAGDGSVVAVPGINLANNFDIVALAKYAAGHSANDCLVFPEVIEEPQKEQPVEPVAEDQFREGSRRFETSNPVHHGSRQISEDDPGLLEDDKEFEEQESPSVYTNEDTDELPAPEPDANSTRRKLIEKLKELGAKTKDLFRQPIEGEDGGMD